MNNPLKNIKILLNTLALSFPLTISACGGGSNSEKDLVLGLKLLVRKN